MTEDKTTPEELDLEEGDVVALLDEGQVRIGHILPPTRGSDMGGKVRIRLHDTDETAMVRPSSLTRLATLLELSDLGLVRDGLHQWYRESDGSDGTRKSVLLIWVKSEDHWRVIARPEPQSAPRTILAASLPTMAEALAWLREYDASVETQVPDLSRVDLADIPSHPGEDCSDECCLLPAEDNWLASNEDVYSDPTPPVAWAMERVPAVPKGAERAEAARMWEWVVSNLITGAGLPVPDSISVQDGRVVVYLSGANAAQTWVEAFDAPVQVSWSEHAGQWRRLVINDSRVIRAGWSIQILGTTLVGKPVETKDVVTVSGGSSQFDVWDLHRMDGLPRALVAPRDPKDEREAFWVDASLLNVVVPSKILYVHTDAGGVELCGDKPQTTEGPWLTDNPTEVTCPECQECMADEERPEALDQD